MSNTTNEELIKNWVRELDTSDLIELWQTLTSEINNPSVIWDMDFFLEDYLPECLNAKTIDVIDLAHIVTGNDGLVKHFDINDDFVYVNSSCLWESINEYDIADLLIDLIDSYDMTEYSDTLKDKLAELKEDSNQEEEEANEDLKND